MHPPQATSLTTCATRVVVVICKEHVDWHIHDDEDGICNHGPNDSVLPNSKCPIRISIIKYLAQPQERPKVRVTFTSLTKLVILWEELCSLELFEYICRRKLGFHSLSLPQRRQLVTAQVRHSLPVCNKTTYKALRLRHSKNNSLPS